LSTDSNPRPEILNPKSYQFRSYWAHFWHWFNWANYAVFIITLVYKIQFWMPSLAYVNAPGDLDIQRATLDFESLGWTYYMVLAPRNP
jgi:hypothetical protein